MLELAPAYGRDYKSKAAVLKDWEDGKDFQICGSGSYINLEDAKNHHSPLTLNIRYDKMTKVVVVKILNKGLTVTL